MNQSRRPTCCRVFWDTAELVAITVDFLDPKSLSRCARVSKALSGHALDSLYRDAVPFTNILGLLCPMKLDPSTGTLVRSLEYYYCALLISEQGFVGPLRRANWERFRHYNRRIRKIHVGYHEIQVRSISQNSIIDLLGTLPRKEAFLPCLTTLDWQNIQPPLIQIVMMLFHDGLKEAAWSASPSDSESLLEQVLLRSPNLQSLQLWIPRPITSFAQLIMSTKEAIGALPLRSVKVGQDLVTPDLLYTISQKPTVEQFWGTTYGPNLTRSRETLGCSTCPVFSPLFEFSVDSNNFLRGSEHILWASRLVSLHVTLMHLDHITEVLTQISAIQLKDLMMTLNNWPSATMPAVLPPALTMDILTPLLTMRSLEIFVIEHPVPPRLNDEDLEQIARSLPELRHIEFCALARPGSQEEVPTLGCLIPFAQYCRKLTSIAIYMDASVPPPPLPLGQRTFTSSLEVVYVFCSKIGNCGLVVDFLQSILPHSARLEWSKCSHHLRSVIAPMDLHYPPALDAESSQYASHWQYASSLLSTLSGTRKLLALQRTKIEMLERGMVSY